MTINVVIVRQDATTITFQADGWGAAIREALRIAADPFYRVRNADAFFMSAMSDRVLERYEEPVLEQHTIGETKRDARQLLGGTDMDGSRI